ncbi:MAG: molybdopterin-dependent oxidoreductase [Spirochaetales bacterium]|nr:molybdopterin-dependent oxidoreductase [Spirochaetales bacterium]
MADNSNNRYGKDEQRCYGTLVLSDVAKSDLISINFPSDNRCTPVTWEDFPGENCIKAFSGAMPILAKNDIRYQGQPILAVVGPDYESVLLSANAVTFDIEEREEEESDRNSSDIPEELVLSWTTPKDMEEDAEEEPLKKIETVFESRSVNTNNFSLITCLAWQSEGRVHIEIPCRWPDLVKETVANAIDFPQKNIFVHALPCHSHYDEYAIFPAQLAAIAAVAALKVDMLVELRSNLYSRSPEVSIKRTTWCDKNSNPITEEVEMNAELGAYLFAPDEYQRQAITGLIPNYTLQNFTAKVSVSKSSRYPSVFFGSMGYSVALASSEVHVDDIAKKYGLSPLAWRNLHLEGKRRFTDYLPSIELSPLKNLYKKIVVQSGYGRKWPSYALQNGSMSLLDFSRGIGLAVGVGISGFSTTLAKKTNYQAKLNYTEKNNITLSVSFPTKGYNGHLIRGILTQEMRVKDEGDVILFDSDTGTVNSGPDVLNRVSGKFPKQLISGCRKLQRMAKVKELPFSLTLDTDDKMNPCEFENSGSMAVIIEVIADDVSFRPVVRSVWANVMVGLIFNEKELKATMRHEIIETLNISGAVLSTDLKHPFTVNINIESRNTDGVCSMTQALQALVQAAFIDAIRQCTGSKKAILPVKPEYLAESQGVTR